jgi:hypothetical protein
MQHPRQPRELNKEKENMSTGNPAIDALAAQAATNESVEDSAVVVLNGIAAQITAAVNAALAGGATAAQLAAVSQVATDLNTHATALAAAVAANTPATTPPAAQR